jgi:thiol-disulfide isomerase/thioredoxin
MGNAVGNSRTILIEVMYKADYCLPCLYMDEAVLEVLPRYGNHVEYRKVFFMKQDGKKRFLELSMSLYGEENFKRFNRLAPVPSLFIDGELVFDMIPPGFELEDAIEEALRNKGIIAKDGDLK